MLPVVFSAPLVRNNGLYVIDVHWHEGPPDICVKQGTSNILFSETCGCSFSSILPNKFRLHVLLAGGVESVTIRVERSKRGRDREKEGERER